MPLPKLDSQFSKTGFSLIELLIVISIIGVLLTTISFSFTNAQQKSRDGRRKTDLKSTQQALEVYYQANGKYPATSAGQIQCNVTGDSTTKSWGSAFTCATTVYLSKLPNDPSSASGNYCYASGSSFVYTLNANLENANDLDKLATPVSCNGGSYNYSVSNP